MSIFRLGKSRLQKAIYCATVDPSAYDKVYDIVAKQNDAFARTLDVVLSAIETSWQHEQQQKEQASRKSTSHTRFSSANSQSQHSSSNKTKRPTDIRTCTALLQVLHGVVMSFPREAARVFGEKTSASRVLMCIRASATPLDIRLILVSLASRWCVLLKPEPRAARYLASIVDSFYHHNGLSPSLSFLPPTPPRMRIQAEWPYPTSEPDDESRIFMYTTPVVGKAQSGTASRSRSSSAEAQRPHMNGASSGRVSAQSSAPHSSGPTDLPVDQLERMDNCAQELTSLGGMLIDNLVTLPIDEDPQTNKVIQDTLKEVNRLNSIVANYISALTSEHTLTTRRLKLATDETKRCHWVYKDSVAAFTEWSYRQLDYAAKTSNRLSMALPSSAAGSSLSAQPRQQQQAAKAMQSTVAGAALATPPSSEEMAPSILRNAVESLAPPALARVSTKAKGKMPDMGPPSPLPRTAHTN